MSTNESRARGLLRLRHARECHEAREEDMAHERRRFLSLADPASAPRAIVADQLFQTPPALAARLAALVPAGVSTLEPSAGLGRIYRALRDLDVRPIVLVEIAPACCGELYRQIEGDPNARLIQGDFLEQCPEQLGRFGAVVMNPPFRRGTDVRHIQHACRFLAPGGVLVAVCYAGLIQERKLRPLVDSWEELPPGSFRSEGTEAATAIVTVRAKR